MAQTLNSLLQRRANLLKVRSNKQATQGLSKLYQLIHNGADIDANRYVAQLSKEVGINADLLETYYEWLYETVRVETGFLIIRDHPKKGISVESRFYGEHGVDGFPHGTRTVAMFSGTDCYFHGYIPDKLKDECISVIQEILLAFWQLNVTADQINLHGYTKF